MTVTHADPGVILGLSLVQPWASSVALYGADVLNRTRPLPPKYIGARVAILAASYRDPFRETVERRRIRERIGVTLPADLPRGAVVAVARLVSCTERSSSPWFEGPYGWLVEDVLPVSPFPALGVSRLSPLSYETANLLRSRLDEG